MKKSLKARFGTFFIVLGIGALLAFIAYFVRGDITSNFVAFDLLALGIVLLLIGITMQDKPPKTENPRFATIRKMRQKQAEKAKKK